MENKIKVQNIKSENKQIIFDSQEMFNQEYINDLMQLLKTNTAVPTHTPRKLIDCIYLYWDGSTTYELYLYINNTWKRVTLS
jgi:hypothetical protein